MDIISAKVTSLQEQVIEDRGIEEKWSEVVSRGNQMQHITGCKPSPLPAMDNRYKLLET
jgi:hypothetical protein